MLYYLDGSAYLDFGYNHQIIYMGKLLYPDILFYLYYKLYHASCLFFMIFEQREVATLHRFWVFECLFKGAFVAFRKNLHWLHAIRLNFFFNTIE